MNDELQLFENEEFGAIRVTEINGTPWFVGKDVACALGYTNTRDAIYKHVDDEDKGVAKCDTLGGNQDMAIINESGMYSLVLSSKLPGAKRFKHWVTSDVLPSIRKHGMYATEATIDKMIASPEFGIKLLTQLKEERERRKALEEENQLMLPKAEYFDELVDRNTLTSFRDTAKELGIKPKAFTNWLLDNGYIYHDQKDKLMPYSNKNSGLFEVKECFNDKNKWSGVQTMVTPRGRETFRILCRDL